MSAQPTSPDRQVASLHDVMDAFGGCPGGLRDLVESTGHDWVPFSLLDVPVVTDAAGMVHGRDCLTLASSRVADLTPLVLCLDEIDELTDGEDLCPECILEAITAEVATLAADDEYLGQGDAQTLSEILATAPDLLAALRDADGCEQIVPGSEGEWYAVVSRLQNARHWPYEGLWARVADARADLLERLARNGRVSGELDEWARRHHLWTTCCDGTVDRASLGPCVTVPMGEECPITIPVPAGYENHDPGQLLGRFDSFAVQRPAQQPQTEEDATLWEHWRSLPDHTLSGRLAVVALRPGAHGADDSGPLGFLVGFAPVALVVDAHTAAFLHYRAEAEDWECASRPIPHNHRDLAPLEATVTTLVTDGMALDDALASALAATG